MRKLSYDFLKAQLCREGRYAEDSYLNSALYYMITGRKGQKNLYTNGHSAVVICEHPHIENRLMVFPELGKADYELTSAVLSSQITPPENGVQLARYSEENIKTLKQKFNRLNYTPVTNINIINEPIMDWRYPIHILDTQTVSKMQGSGFKGIRNKVRKASETVTTSRLNTAQNVRHMRAALKFWEGSMIYNEKDTPDMSEFYHALFEQLQNKEESAHKRIDGLLFMADKRPVGFAIWDTQNNTHANLLVKLGDTSITGLSEFQMVSVAQVLSENGIQNLNIGGAETQTLDAFKRKFQPKKSIPLYSAEVLYKTPANVNIESYTF